MICCFSLEQQQQQLIKQANDRLIHKLCTSNTIDHTHTQTQHHTKSTRTLRWWSSSSLLFHYLKNHDLDCLTSRTIMNVTRTLTSIHRPRAKRATGCTGDDFATVKLVATRFVPQHPAEWKRIFHDSDTMFSLAALESGLFTPYQRATLLSLSLFRFGSVYALRGGMAGYNAIFTTHSYVWMCILGSFSLLLHLACRRLVLD